MGKVKLNRREALAVLGSGLSTGMIQPAEAPAGALARGFLEPPDSARPWTFWLWLNGNITREGITDDLEAMKAAGIGGVIIMSIEGGVKPGPVEFMSAEWRDIFRHMVAEAARLGIEVDMNNDDGWDCGGPWITPEHAMKKMVWTESRISGGRHVSIGLPQPQTVLDYYRDTCVLAIPAPPEEQTPGARSEAVPGQPSYLEVALPEAIAARSAVVGAGKNTRENPMFCELLASEDGERFRSVVKFETGWQYPMSGHPSVTAGFDAVRGRVFRLLLHGSGGKTVNPKNLSFSVSGAQRVSNWELKAGHWQIREHGSGAHLMAWPDRAPAADPRGAIPKSDVIDLTARAKSGLLEWDAPAGNWTILRIGYTCTGRTNGAATKKGKGLDCDKLSRSGVEAHFDGMMSKLIADVKPFIGKGLKAFHNDSWESGPQTWTAGFEREFRNRRGYDPLPYLPVMAGGRVVENSDASERFLWDLRRTMADLIRDVYWAWFKRFCHENGLKVSVEAAGRQQFLYDPINLLSQSDMPMGEFWVGEDWARPDCKLAASVAHLTGGNIAGAEAFTSNHPCGNPAPGWWRESPFSLKARGDHAFCTGINRLIFHRFVHQPRKAHGPGLAWPGTGTNLDRTQTWWEPGKAWLRYIARCQYLLQQGRFIADLCVLTGEGAPNATARKTFGPRRPEGEDASTATEAALCRTGLMPDVPPGFDFDACSPDTVARMRVENGRLALPGGMSYAVLVLPPDRRMTPGLLRHVAALVEAGATVAGPKPEASPSLSDWRNADREVRRLAGEVWGDSEGGATGEHRYGKGRVVWGAPLQQVLPAPDFAYTGANRDARLDYIHRSGSEAEIYFISNQRQRVEEVECAFRVSGRQPQLWDPDTGGIRGIADYREADGRTIVPLRFDPSGSVFVVFPVRAPGESRKAAAGMLPEPLPVQGPWRVAFPPGWGAPESLVFDRLISWTAHADEGVRHFSGAAVYTAAFNMPAALLKKAGAWSLDLGNVAVIAEIAINGNRAGALWKPPFRGDISRWLKPGRNRIEVRVTNLWPNRLIGDAGLPEERRIAATNWNPYKPDSPLLESGLLGPVIVTPSV